VVFDKRARLHLEDRRPELLRHLDAIMETVSRPDLRRDDPLAGRERFYRQHLDSKRWLRVVVDFGEEPARVVTAIILRNDPRG
jgi:hypothetical protein